MDNGVAIGLVIGIAIGLTVTLVAVHLAKPAMEVATVNYVQNLAADTLGGDLPAPVIAAVRPILLGAVHAAFAEIPI